MTLVSPRQTTACEGPHKLALSLFLPSPATIGVRGSLPHGRGRLMTCARQLRTLLLGRLVNRRLPRWVD